MLKIVIVDDEVNIVEGLKKTIPWKEHGCQVVGTAYDGIEAMEVAEQAAPDILIADITMPGIDGLELAKKLKPRFPAMQVIYLTCHDDFEIARSAFRTGACDYIVKETMTREELYHSIQKARQEIESYRENMLNKAVVSNELKTLPYGLDFSRGDYTMVLLSILPEREDELEGTAPDRLKQLVLQWQDSFLFRRTDYESIIMLKNGGNDPRQHIQELAGAVGQELEKTRILTHFYASVEICTEENLNRIYERLCSLKKSRFYRKQKLLFAEDSTGEAANWSTSSVLTVIQKQCEEGIHEIDTEKAVEALRRYIETACSLQCDPSQVLADSEKLLVALLQQAVKLDMTLPDVLSCLQKNRLGQVCSIYELENQMSRLLVDGIALLRESVTTGSNETLTKALAYIEDNLGERLSLGRVALHVAMNTSYFSRYFKEKMGENFVDYLVRKRIDRAKEKLRFTGLSVETIASEVGYSNISYFNESFRKATGMTPGAYRKQMK
ncbi:MAG: response regulator [Lachnospiraceae bacterium]|nr:response regulator [Lachnospiraceae bacterium]